MLQVRLYLERLRTSYWFMPTLLTALAVGLSFAGVAADRALEERTELRFDWVYTGTAEGARQLLATVAGSMMTVAGVVFSITMVSLTLASSQFGPRLLRNFMRDRGNQIVLGTFLATFAYCLLVLRTIRGENGGDFVPQLSITLAVAMAIASVGVLIFFIHHTAVSLQAPVVIANVFRELQAGIDHQFPEDADSSAERSEAARAHGGETAGAARELRAPRDGYLESIDDDALLAIAVEHGLRIELRRRPGHFIVSGSPLARVIALEDARGAECDDRVLEAIRIGSQQTPLQDVEFVINQLVEIAVRALSTGINDPFTAITCVDYLGAALSRLAQRQMPSSVRCDEHGTVRIVRDALTFPDLAETAFRQLRQYSRRTPSVVIRLLEAIAGIVEHTSRKEDRAALLRQARLILEAASGFQPCDLDAAHDRLRSIEAACRGRAAALNP